MDTNQLLTKLKEAIFHQLSTPENLSPRGLSDLGALIIEIAEFEKIQSQTNPFQALPMEAFPALPFQMD